MTDLEITKLCAGAMGYKIVDDFSDVTPPMRGIDVKLAPTCTLPTRYDPLHDDAQAMALVKRFEPDVQWWNDGELHMRIWRRDAKGWLLDYFEYNGPDFNRAICECVANLQQSKS